MTSLAAPILLALQAATVPQLIDIEGLSTEKAGKLILAGQAHRPIVAIGEQPAFGPPGLVELKLAESPVRLDKGCHRRMWTARFLLPVEGHSGTGGLQSPYAVDEVALVPSRPCELAAYSTLASPLAAGRGLELLAALRSFGAVSAKLRFRCSDSTASDLCRDDAHMKMALRDLPVWHIASRDGEAVMWLGVPGQVVTEVRFDPDRTGPITLDRRIPAPA
ncbi:hypothetical protein [Sphingopyxis panaciterrae]